MEKKQITKAVSIGLKVTTLIIALILIGFYKIDYFYQPNRELTIDSPSDSENITTLSPSPFPYSRPPIVDVADLEFIWPMKGKVVGKYTSFHQAIDICNHALSPVVAAESGIITLSNASELSHQPSVIINHRHGFQSTYIQMTEVNVKDGSTVKKGQKIGSSQKCHPLYYLHFTLSHNQDKLDPLDYLPKEEDPFP